MNASRRDGVMMTQDFDRALALIPNGYSEGAFSGRRWGVTVRRSDDIRRLWLFAEELGGPDIVSFNLYVVASGGALLKPCEMSSNKVIKFILGFQPSKLIRTEGKHENHEPECLGRKTA